MKTNQTKLSMRKKRAIRVRMKIRATSKVPRLILFRSLTSLYAQIVDDVQHKTIFSIAMKQNNMQGAVTLGKQVGEQLKAHKISAVAFDRSGRQYHGVTKAFVDTVRQGGIHV